MVQKCKGIQTTNHAKHQEYNCTNGDFVLKVLVQVTTLCKSIVDMLSGDMH